MCEINTKEQGLTMDQIILRFPVIAEQIFGELDDQNLTKCREISKTWCDATERLQWTRKIQRLTKENKKHQDSWKLVLVKIPTEFLKKLALTCEEYDDDIFEWQRSPLHTAAYGGDFQLFEHIYEKSKEKNPKDKYGTTPLHTAAGQGSLEVCKFIMERVEEKNPKNENGWTALHLAAAHGHLEICKLICGNISSLNLRTDGGGTTPLHQAAIEGHLEICKLLVLKVEDKNPSTIDGFTPLHAAAREGYLEIYKFIANRVEDKNPEDGDGRTPLQFATNNGHYEMCRLICNLLICTYDKKLSNPEKKRRKKK
jgi:ankyrin repeat protein